MKLRAEWITGFVDGEGCFRVGIDANAEMQASFEILPEFTVVQHERDVQILHALKNYFACGVVVHGDHVDRVVYRVRNADHLLSIIVPFFMKHPLKTRKNVNFRKFRKILLRMEKGVHLTSEGVGEIRRIAAQMDVARTSRADE